MTNGFAYQILIKLRELGELYHRLVLVVAPAGSGKTTALRSVQGHIDAPLVNVNLQLALQMLDLTERQRALRLPQLLSEVVDAQGGPLVLLDNIEILFDTSLKQDPLRLLQRLSRTKTVIAAWSGDVVDDSITYAAPNHPEYRRYPVAGDFLIVCLDSARKAVELNTTEAG